MPGEVIDTAFVEIVPLVSPGFQGQVAAGIRKGTSDTSHQGLLAGGAFSREFVKGFAGLTVAAIGVEKISEGLHEGVVNAGLLQKQGEAIDVTFGRAGDQVKEFADTTHEFGLSSLESEKLSVRIGILAHNLGIAAPMAAEMTIGLQKLGGSIAEIRGLEPSGVLSRLPLVLTGNLRAIKELGFSFTQTQIRAEALAKGFLHQGETITPTARALAIYSLLIKQLPFFEAKAAENSDDLTNKQHRLAAQTEDLKTKTGALLAGPFSALEGRLIEIEDGAVKAGEGLKTLGDEGDSSFKRLDKHLPKWLRNALEGHQITNFFGASIVKPFEILHDRIESAARDLHLIDGTTVTVNFEWDVTAVAAKDPLTQAVLGLGPLSAGGGPPKIQGAQRRAFQDFLPEGPTSAAPTKLRTQITPEQGAVEQRLEDQTELARATGNMRRLKASLRSLRKFWENLAANDKESLAIRRGARVQIAQIDEQIRQIDQQAADDAKQAARDRQQAAEARQDSLIAQLTANADFLRQAAALTPSPTDDIRAEQHFIKVLERERDILRKAHRDATSINNEIRTEQLALKGLQAQAAEDRARATEDRLLDLRTIAGFTKGLGDDERALLALEKFYAGRVRASRKGSVARRKWMVELARTRAELRDLRDEEKKTTDAQREAARQGAFDFLQTTRGFAENLASNLLGITTGLVGGTAAQSPPAERTPLPKPSDIKIPLPAQTTVAAAATRASGGKPASSTQLETLIHLGRQQLSQLVAIRSTTTHVEALTSKELTRVRTATS